MSRMPTRLALAAATALCIGLGHATIHPLATVPIALAATEPPPDARADPRQAAWQQQWQLLLRREEQLHRDQQQVQTIAPRLQPALVEELERGLEQTGQRLAQRRQQLIQERPPEPDPATTT